MCTPKVNMFNSKRLKKIIIKVLDLLEELVGLKVLRKRNDNTINFLPKLI